jgi:hypothetical protein
MKRVFSVLSVMAATLLISAMPTLGDEGTMKTFEEKGKVGECVIANLDCRDKAEALQVRVINLKKEIAKGATIYTNDELNTMYRKLDELNSKLIDALTYGGGS